MRSWLIKSFAITAIAALQSHAIFGLGGHWSAAPSLSVKASEGAAFTGANQSLTIDNKGSDGLNGFGLKLWVDAIPFVDIEASGNIQFSEYDVNLKIGNNVTPVTFDLGFPMAPDKPAFIRAYGDVAILYPFLKLPPLVSLIKLYGGAGMSYGAATEVLDADFAKHAISHANGKNGFDANNASASAITKVLADAIIDEGMKSGVGFFLQVGAKAKPPVIPIAIYVDGKYQFQGFMPKAVEGAALSLEIGGALAF